VRALALLLLAGLAACAGGAALQPGAMLPTAARVEPLHYLVVTVRNPTVAPATRAASTAHGYDNIGPYLAGSSARRSSESLAADYQLEEAASWPIALLGVHCLVYAVRADADTAVLLARLARDPRVESAQPLFAFSTLAAPYNDPYAELQRNVLQMAIAQAHGLSRGGGVRVAVIDTGVDVGHPDLPPRGTQTRNFVDTDAQAFRADAHGTAVAGVIAAVPNNGIGIVGVAPDAQLLAYKACWRAATGMGGVCNTFTLAQALAAAIEARADIINLSLAGPSDPLLTRLVNQGLERGAIVVGAVPADGLRRLFPTDIEGVIAVDAVESGHRAADTIAAPGRDILSLAPDGHYDFYSGSSLAAAEVSGLVALLRAERPRLTGREAMAVLNQSPPAGGLGGVPNACTALAALMQRPPCSSP
jgi:subtilisin family serine protease